MFLYRKIAVAAAVFALLTGCYIEGGGCNGPVCFGVSTDICTSGLSCDSDNNSNQNNRCPDADDVQRNALQAVNRARANSSRCGFSTSQVLNPINWNNELFSVADLHSLDMASNSFVSALGSNGLGLTERLTGISFGYSSQSVAGGFASANEVIEGWLTDTSECNKINSRAASRFALACRADNDSQYRTYWTLVMTGP